MAAISKCEKVVKGQRSAKAQDAEQKVGESDAQVR